MGDRFVSTKELEEIRKRRQEEWERVRKPDDPIEVPEEEVDNRSLYERLKEVRDKKQAEWEEEHKFKNMIRGLDTDETDFLSKVDCIRAEEDRRKKEEEKAILSECSKARSKEVDDSAVPSVSQLKPPPVNNKGPKESKQAALIRTAIKRKNTSEDRDEKSDEKKVAVENSEPNGKKPMGVPAMTVIGVLPGIVHYSSSSDSDSTSDSNSDSTDDMPVLPVLIQSTPEKVEKSKPPPAESTDEE